MYQHEKRVQFWIRKFPDKPSKVCTHMQSQLRWGSCMDRSMIKRLGPDPQRHCGHLDIYSKMHALLSTGFKDNIGVTAAFCTFATRKRSRKFSAAEPPFWKLSMKWILGNLTAGLLHCYHSDGSLEAKRHFGGKRQLACSGSNSSVPRKWRSI